MAPKGAKRGTTGAAAAAKKKAKVAEIQPEDPVIAKCAAIQQGLEQAELPETVREMLVAMLPLSLGIPQDQRHETQTEVVGMIGEIFKDIEARLAKCLEEAQSQVNAEAEDKAAKEAERQRLEGLHAAQLQEVDEKKAALLSSTEAVKAAQATLAAAKEEQVASAARVEAASGTKQKCETTTTENLRKLLEGEWEQAAEARKICTELMDAGKELSFDQSLLQGMPAAAEKKPADRGVFDSMLLEQYQKHLATSIENLEERMASAGTLAAEQEANVSGATADLQACNDTEAAARGQLEAAEAQCTALHSELEAARKEEKACGPKGIKAHQAFKFAEVDLESFRRDHVSVFEELRDRDEAKPAVAVEAEHPVTAEVVPAA